MVSAGYQGISSAVLPEHLSDNPVPGLSQLLEATCTAGSPTYLLPPLPPFPSLLLLLPSYLRSQQQHLPV